MNSNPVLFCSWSRAKTATLMLTLTFYSGGEENGGKYSERENFWRVLVSVSESLVSEKVSVLVLENLVSEKSIGFGEFGLGKKYWLRFRKIWSRFGFRKKISVLVSVEFWHFHSVILLCWWRDRRFTPNEPKASGNSEFIKKTFPNQDDSVWKVSHQTTFCN